MQLVTPDLVADVCSLSLGVLVATAAIGIVLWLFGWRSHRFWIVLLTTVAAGLYGLQEGVAFRAPPLVAALLLAIAAGVLALALIRLLAFGAGGFSGLLLVHGAAPNLEQPLVVFVLSGLASLLLFRWFMMALSSGAGSLLVGGAILAIMNKYGTLDATAWTEQSMHLLNWIWLLMALVGFLLQFLLDRRARRHADDEDDSAGMVFPFSRFYRRAG